MMKLKFPIFFAFFTIIAVFQSNCQDTTTDDPAYDDTDYPTYGTDYPTYEDDYPTEPEDETDPTDEPISSTTLAPTTTTSSTTTLAPTISTTKRKTTTTTTTSTTPATTTLTTTSTSTSSTTTSTTTKPTIRKPTCNNTYICVHIVNCKKSLCSFNSLQKMRQWNRNHPKCIPYKKSMDQECRRKQCLCQAKKYLFKFFKR